MIAIYASEAAACIGDNKYQPVHEIAKTIWRKTDQKGFTAALQRHNLKEALQTADVIESIGITEKIQDVTRNSCPQRAYNQLEHILLDVTDDSLKKDIESYVRKERGRIGEEKALDDLQEVIGSKIEQRNSNFYKMFIDYESNGSKKKFMLGGKVDGITESGELVETKCRQYRIFTKVPPYEMVQIHIYMVLTGRTSCKFVQSYKDQLDCRTIEFDGEKFQDIKERLKEFVIKLDALLSSEELQDKLLESNEF